MDPPDGLDPARYCSFCQGTFPEIGDLFGLGGGGGSGGDLMRATGGGGGGSGGDLMSNPRSG